MGSNPGSQIFLCMVEKRRVEEGLREFPFQAIESFLDEISYE